jgi:hypothetical protein
MLDNKSVFIEALAHDVLSRQIATGQELGAAITKGYKEHGIIYPWVRRRPECEYTEICLAAKQKYDIDLSSFKPVARNVAYAQIAQLIQSRGSPREILDSALRAYEKHEVAEVCKVPFILWDLEEISMQEARDFMFACRKDMPEHTFLYDSFLKGYIGNRIIEGIMTGEIKSRNRKEVIKNSLARSFGLEKPPSDENIHHRIVQSNPHVAFPEESLQELLCLTPVSEAQETVPSQPPKEYYFFET